MIANIYRIVDHHHPTIQYNDYTLLLYVCVRLSRKYIASLFDVHTANNISAVLTGLLMQYHMRL